MLYWYGIRTHPSPDDVSDEESHDSGQRNEADDGHHVHGGAGHVVQDHHVVVVAGDRVGGRVLVLVVGIGRPKVRSRVLRGSRPYRYHLLVLIIIVSDWQERARC